MSKRPALTEFIIQFMSDKKKLVSAGDLLKEINEYCATHGWKGFSHNGLVMAAKALSEQEGSFLELVTNQGKRWSKYGSPGRTMYFVWIPNVKKIGHPVQTAGEMLDNAQERTERAHWERIKEAVLKSPWISPDEPMEDWVDAVCHFLLDTKPPKVGPYQEFPNVTQAMIERGLKSLFIDLA